MGQHELAVETLEELAADEPGRRAAALLALAEIHRGRGDAERTAAALGRFREAWKSADRTLPQFAVAERLAAQR